jgi:hypothetical protein
MSRICMMPSISSNRGARACGGDEGKDGPFSGIDLLQAKFGERTPISRGSDGTVFRRQVTVSGKSLDVVEKNGWGRLILCKPGAHPGINLPIYWPFRPGRQLKILKDLRESGVDTVDFYPNLVGNRIVMEDLTEGGNHKIGIFDLRHLTESST